MKNKVCISLITVLVVGAWMTAPSAISQEQSASSRNVMHVTKVEVMPVGDVEGHAIGIYEAKGLVFGKDGQMIAVQTQCGSFDSTNGKGPIRGYSKSTFQDGSTIMSKWEGALTPNPEGKSYSSQGTYELVSGTGQFKGITGKGTWTGGGVYGLSSYSDSTGTFTLSSQ